MSNDVHDYSRIDAYAASRRRTMLLHAAWRPMLAGAAGAALVIAAVYVTLPKISYREIEVPRVTMRDVTVPNIVPKDVEVDHVVPKEVEIPVPRMVPTAPETSTVSPRTPEERRFEESPEWQGAIVRGRILREQANGFVLATESGEVEFFPAKLGPNGPESNPTMKDDIRAFIGLLGLCRKNSVGLYECVAVQRDGSKAVIKQIPIGPMAGKPTRGVMEILTRPETIEARQ